MSQLVLSLFPGIGLLDTAFEEEGFCVVRGPDLLWGGDIRRFHPPAGKFDGVIGGPPCQMFSRFRYVNPKCGQKHGNLIPEFERCVQEARPAWFVMENVPDAPSPSIEGYQVKQHLICDVWVGGDTMRKRMFSFGTWQSLDCLKLEIDWLPLHRPDPELSAYASGGNRPVPMKMNANGKIKLSAAKNMGWKTAAAAAENALKQGLPADFLSESPFTAAGKCKVIGNGVPMAMGRAIAKAVKATLAARA